MTINLGRRSRRKYHRFSGAVGRSGVDAARYKNQAQAVKLGGV
jgi:hypothetical protein